MGSYVNVFKIREKKYVYGYRTGPEAPDTSVNDLPTHYCYNVRTAETVLSWQIFSYHDFLNVENTLDR